MSSGPPYAELHAILTRLHADDRSVIYGTVLLAFALGFAIGGTCVVLFLEALGHYWRKRIEGARKEALE